jgi:hypothetical protein
LGTSLVPLATGPVENASATVTVGADGLVTGLRLTYDTTFGGGPAEVTITHRLVDRGTTTVERPAWVPSDGDR